MWEKNWKLTGRISLCIKFSSPVNCCCCIFLKEQHTRLWLVPLLLIWVLLMLCNFLSCRTVCRTLDVSPTSSSPQESADLKFQRGGSKWHQLSYTYNINLNFWIPKNKPSQSLYKTIIVRLRWRVLASLCKFQTAVKWHIPFWDVLVNIGISISPFTYNGNTY